MSFLCQCLLFSNGFFPTCLHSKILHASLLYPIHATFPAQLKYSPKPNQAYKDRIEVLYGVLLDIKVFWCVTPCQSFRYSQIFWSIVLTDTDDESTITFQNVDRSSDCRRRDVSWRLSKQRITLMQSGVFTVELLWELVLVGCQQLHGSNYFYYFVVYLTTL